MSNPLKILFIKPPRGEGPEAIDVPMGILYLSAYAKRYLKEQVEIELIDLRLTRKIGQELIAKINTFQPDIIGISLVAKDKKFLNVCTKLLRLNAPDVKIVIGGPLVTYDFEDLLLTNREVDWAVVGEGEKVFFDIVRTLITGGEINHLDGIAYFDGKKVVSNPKSDFIEDLDTLPFPDYSLVNLPDYWGRFGNMNGVLAERRYTSIISSRGCPFQCLYCHKIFGRTVRNRSPENFIQEIRWLYDKFNIREFHIIDDIFNADRERMHTVLNMIIESGMKIKLAFPNGLRGDMLEKEDIDLLKQAGTYMLTVAFESASPRIQKILKKNLDINKTLENINYASGIGLLSRGFFMLGFPGETIHEIHSTIKLAAKSKLDFASFFSVIPFKGTELAKLVESMYPNLIYNAGCEFWDKKPFYNLATGYSLKKAQLIAYFKFYFPFRAFKTFMKMPSSSNRFVIPFRWAILVIFPKEKTAYWK